MRKNTPIQLLAIFCLVLFGCKTEKNNSGQNDNESPRIIHVSLDSERNNCVEKYFTYQSFIALEGTPDSFIKNINKVHFTDNEIIILDSDQKSIFIFDLTGSFKRKICKVGRSQGEYFSINDIYYDKKKKHIFAYDDLARKILEYTLDGKYIKSYDVTSGYAFTKTNTNHWIIYRGNGSADMSKESQNLYNVCVYDEEFNRKGEYLPFSEHLQGRRLRYGTINSSFSVCNDDIYILPLLSNTVYGYDEKSNSVTPHYEIVFEKFENESLTEHSTQAQIENYILKVNEGNIPRHINNFRKINNIIMFGFTYSDKKGLLMCVYDQESNKTDVCDFIFDENKLFFSPSIYTSDKNNDLILSIINGRNLEISKNKSPNNPIVNKIYSSVGNVQDCNPILVFYSIKRPQ